MDTRGFFLGVKVGRVWSWLLIPVQAKVKKITDAVTVLPHVSSHYAQAQLYLYLRMTYDMNVTNAISLLSYNLSCHIINTFWDYIVPFLQMILKWNNAV